MQRGKTPPPVAQSVGTANSTDYISAEGYDSPNECPVAHSAGAAEYTDYIPANRLDSPNVSPRYDTRQSDC